MDRLNQINPFSKRESYGRGRVITYKVLSILTWLLSVVVSVGFAVDCPREGLYLRKTIWDQNELYPSGFTLNPVIVSIYWIILFVLQLGYIGHLFSNNLDRVNPACAVGGHFILNNLLHAGFVALFVHSHFVWAEVLLVLNFANLSAMYFRHSGFPRFIHLPAVSAPLAWTFVAIYWNGAFMVPHPGTLVARIFANIFIWGILVYGGFFIVAYKDYTMGFSLSVLSAALGVAQFQRQFIALQWIFAFVIMGVLFAATVLIAVPTWMGRDINFGRRQEPAAADQERAPLLGEN